MKKVEVEPWYISDVHTGYRVVERGPRGYQKIISGHVYDRYKEGDRERAKTEADKALEEYIETSELAI